MLPFRVLNPTWQLSFVPSCFVGLKQRTSWGRRVPNAPLSRPKSYMSAEFVPSCFVGLKQSYLRLHASLLDQLTLRLSPSDWLAYDPGRGVQAKMTYLIAFVCLSLKSGIWLSIPEKVPGWGA